MRNWKTSLSGAGVAAMAILTAIAGAPAELGDVSTILPPKWKATIFTGAAVAGFILRMINAHFQADKAPKP